MNFSLLADIMRPAYSFITPLLMLLGWQTHNNYSLFPAAHILTNQQPSVNGNQSLLGQSDTVCKTLLTGL